MQPIHTLRRALVLSARLYAELASSAWSLVLLAGSALLDRAIHARPAGEMQLARLEARRS